MSFSKPIYSNIDCHVYHVRYFNTLHGFEFDGSMNHVEDNNNGGDDKWFIACLYTEPALDKWDDAQRARIPTNAVRYSDEQLHRKILQLSGFWDGNGDPPKDRVKLNDFIGHPYVEVKRRSDAPACINALLALGYTAQAKTRPMVTFEPSDAPYSIEKAEHLLLERLYRTYGKPLKTPVSMLLGLWPQTILDERLWKTDEGKEFARNALTREPWLNDDKHLQHPLVIYDDPRQPFDLAIDWPEATMALAPPAQVPPAAADDDDAVVVQAPRRKASEESDEIQPKRRAKSDDAKVTEWIEEPLACIACLERPADTMVLPCGHQVVCRQCSDKLKDTLNAHKCILCRRVITEVLADID